MLSENYHKIITYLTQTLGADFIFLFIVLTTVASIAYFVLVSYIITQMDKRYFIRKITLNKTSSSSMLINSAHINGWDSSVSYLLKFIKIIGGIVLLICGIAMLVLPGQGLLTILIGLSLLPFPGKNKLEQNLLARKSVQSSLNWIRIKANKEPFIFD